MSEGDHRVPGLSRRQIRAAAAEIRDHLGASNAPWLDILRFLDLVLPTLDPAFRLEVVEDDDAHLDGAHALYRPRDNTILVSETVYCRAEQGEGRDRMTLAHEYGHYVLHRGVSPEFARTAEPRRLRAFESAEWQAKAFAGELLVDRRQLDHLWDSATVSQVFGVSLEAANYQLRKTR